MRRLSSLLAALLLPTAQPLLLGVAVSTGTLLVSQIPSNAQSAEAVAKVAQAITVRIEGATQGSGVLVKREGNRYTVLTAWHVVSGQRPGEELDIFVRDGSRQQLERGSIKRLGEVDLAVLTFTSPNAYEVAQIGDVKSVSMGSPIYVAGFPLVTSAVPARLMRFLKGDVVANAQAFIPNGYQLLYSNQTLPGMSGGAVLNAQGQLVGIHGQGETDSQMSEQQGVTVKTGTNQAVPIAYYSQFASGAAVVSSSGQAASADDYLAQARALLGQKGREQDVIRLATQALGLRQSVEAYFYRVYAKTVLGDGQGAKSDYAYAMAIRPQDAASYFFRGLLHSSPGLHNGDRAISDLSQAIAINPRYAEAYNARGKIKSDFQDFQGAITDFSKALEINPSLAEAYFNRAISRDGLGDKRGAMADFGSALEINPRLDEVYFYLANMKLGSRDLHGSIADYDQAIGINPLPLYYYNRALVKEELGDNHEAIIDLSKAIAIRPSASAYRERGRIMDVLGERDAACDDYRKAVSLADKSHADLIYSEVGASCRNMP